MIKNNKKYYTEVICVNEYMNKLWSISDIAKELHVSNKTILNHCKKHRIISTNDKQGKTYWLSDGQRQRLLYVCYPKSYGLFYGDPLQEVSMQQPIPKAIGKISKITYKKTGKNYFRIVKFPLKYTDDGDIVYYKTQTFDTKEEATAFRQELINRRNSGEFQQAQSIVSFYDIAKDILDKRTYKRNTRWSVDNVLENHFKPFFKDIPLSSINRQLLQEFLDSTNKSKTVVSSVLNTVLKELWIDDKIPKDYASQLKSPKQKPKQKRPLTVGELKEYFYLIERKPLAFVCKLMFATGLRINEALALTWEDIAFLDNGLCCVHVTKSSTYNSRTKTFYDGTPKTASSVRTVYFNDAELRSILLKEKERALSKYIAYNRKSRKRENYTSFNNKYFYNIGVKMGIHLSSHYARVTYASYAMANGMSIKNIQQQLGHSDSMMLHRVYAKPIGNIIDDVLSFSTSSVLKGAKN